MLNRRAMIAGSAALILLLLFFYARKYGVRMVSGGYSVQPSKDVVISEEPLKLPALPGFKPSFPFYTQTTGLMCECDSAPFTAPVVVRELSIPTPPIPHYAYTPPTIQQMALQPARTYLPFGLNSNLVIWGDRPYQDGWFGSDGRLFLRPKPDGSANISWSGQLIGTDEYYMDGSDIVYGPYRYHRSNDTFSAR